MPHGYALTYMLYTCNPISSLDFNLAVLFLFGAVITSHRACDLGMVDEGVSLLDKCEHRSFLYPFVIYMYVGLFSLPVVHLIL